MSCAPGKLRAGLAYLNQCPLVYNLQSCRMRGPSCGAFDNLPTFCTADTDPRSSISCGLKSTLPGSATGAGRTTHRNVTRHVGWGSDRCQTTTTRPSYAVDPIQIGPIQIGAVPVPRCWRSHCRRSCGPFHIRFATGFLRKQRPSINRDTGVLRLRFWAARLHRQFFISGCWRCSLRWESTTAFPQTIR